MAVNVFLTFQTTKIHVDLRKLEKWYFLLCFGIPGIPAITYLILDTTRGKDYYGDAIVRHYRRTLFLSANTLSYGVGLQHNMIVSESSPSMVLSGK
jgi:hypothetical protein